MRILLTLQLLVALLTVSAQGKTVSPTGETLSNFDVPKSAAGAAGPDTAAGEATGLYGAEKKATILPTQPSELGAPPTAATGNLNDPLNEAYLPKTKTGVADPSAAVKVATGSAAVAAAPDASKTTAGDAERTNTFHGMMTTMCTTVDAVCRKNAGAGSLASQAANLKDIQSQCTQIGHWYPKLCGKLASLKDASDALCGICKGWQPGSLTEPFAKWVDPASKTTAPADPLDPNAGKPGYLATNLNGKFPIDRKWNNVDMVDQDESDSVAVDAANKFYTRLGRAQMHVEHNFMEMYNKFVVDMENEHQSDYAHNYLEKMTARIAKVMNMAKQQTKI